MSLTENGGGNGMVMPVSPMYGSGYGNGFGGFGGDGWWIILLFLFALGGWGNGFGGGYGANGAMPYILNNSTNNDVQRGFDQAAVMGGINTPTSNVCNGFSDVQQSLCNGFAGVNATVNGGFANAETAANARQMANMQQGFGMQTAITGGLDNLSSQLANCCCENRLASADLKYTIATENCADRAAVSDALRDVITNQTANTQRILDQLCSDKIDAKNEKIADLERQLTMANLAASQTAQTSRILADNAAQTVALEQYLNPVPVPAYPVANPNCCNQGSFGCGCGVA